ncbi:MAG TPA: DUF1800 domain-containing protein [Kiritimatiellia bacterium]|nr:DUF1800 domain-containing protein [Kiritimatiellia bacterium]
MLTELPREDWSPTLAAHLVNRAGFGGTLDEILATAAMTPGEAVDRLVDFEAIPDVVEPPAFAAADGADARPDPRATQGMTREERQEYQREERRTEALRIIAARGWWLARMRNTARPLQEKLTLFWHGHFATSFEKVRFAYPMYLQNTTFRAHAAGNFEALVVAVAQDPAMLIYLDNARSNPKQPNENFAREVMELFSLGEGNYAEEDIKNAARAFCGWSLQQEAFRFMERPRLRDTGAKTIFGETGAFNGGDAVRLILKQPAMAPFICAKLWSFFAYDDPEPEVVNALAAVFVKHQLELKPVLRAMFRSRAFYSERARRTQIKSPAQWLAGTTRMLQATLPSDEACAGILATLGQELFQPPNVKGWPGGYTWITADTLLKRYNLAGFLVKGGRVMTQGRPNEALSGGGPLRGQIIKALATMEPAVDADLAVPASVRGDADQLVAHLARVLFQAPLREADQEAVKTYLAKRVGGPFTNTQIRDLLHILMSTPHYQLT